MNAVAPSDCLCCQPIQNAQLLSSRKNWKTFQLAMMKPTDLGTCVLFVAVLLTSLAAFGGWGVLVVAFCLLLTRILHLRRRSLGLPEMGPRTPVVLAVGTLTSFAFVDLYLLWSVTGNDCRPWHPCRHNLERIGAALQEYHHIHGCFPPLHVCNDEGVPIRSWRTLIWPYLRDDSCGSEKSWDNEYCAGEPWDGVENRLLAIQGIAKFHCTTDEPRNCADTSYVAVTGPDTAWRTNRGISLEEITDGQSQTALIVEVLDSGIHWMEPRDVTLERVLDDGNGEASVPSSGHGLPGGYFFRGGRLAGHVLMADGSIVHLGVRPSSTDLAALLSISGNDHVSVSALEAARPLGTQLRWNHIFGLPLFLIAVSWLWIRLLPKSKGTSRAPCPRLP